jgi:ATP-dependent RNA helicase DeaD
MIPYAIPPPNPYTAPPLFPGKVSVPYPFVAAPAFDRHRDEPGAERKPRCKERADAADDARKPRRERAPEAGMERYRIEVGHQHQVKPGNIVGAIANEADIDSKFIGRIEIFDDHSLVDLPEGMPKELLGPLRKVRVAGQQLNMSLAGGEREVAGRKPAASAPSASRPGPKVRQRDTLNKGKSKRARQPKAGR